MAVQKTLPLKAQAYQYLKEKILTCEYAPGEILNETQLCTEMGNISRTPVRDALSRLESEGLVQIRSKKGVVVSRITPQAIHDVYETRMMIEPYNLYYYGKALDKAKLALLLEQLRAADDPNGKGYIVDEDVAFHKMLLDALPNDYVRAAYDKLSSINIRLIILINRTSPRPRNAQQEHIAILEALVAEDWGAAADAMRKHLELSLENALRALVITDAAAQ